MIGLRKSISELLEFLAQELDISETALQDATDRYNSMGAWLNRPQSILLPYRPVIYPQGSINLGTVTKPYNDEDHYDIDLVCEIIRSKAEISQERLKELIGIETKSYAKAHNMSNPADEGRRCWTLEYAEGARFHMDILPAIPDGQRFQQILERHNLHADGLHRLAIAITDKTHLQYKNISEDWPQSNPRGYSEWFKQRMAVQFNERKRLIAESRGKQVHEIPDHAVKTTLQRAIQLLKRHRDFMFGKNSEDKPISIIITTLAAQAYNNEPDLVQALINIIQGLPRFIEYREGGVWIPNPVNPLENFADRWAEEPQRNEAFFNWLEHAENQLITTLQARDGRELNESLSAGFGQGMVNRALSKLPSATSMHPVNYSLKRIDVSESRFQVSHCQLPPWQEKKLGNVRIGGKFSQGKSWLDFRPDTKPLPKSRGLKFKAFTDIPGPFDLYWQVVNTGEQARNANGLRGEIFRGESSGPDAMLRREATSYRGMHWIRCFVVKNGICVGQSAPFVVNIQ
ncbi:MAG: nucleotidyltransferase [Candidatus Obscuribacterales bacterium]|nr:nucleotidyltransferase [Candidatus Obscuribacterales bacterium]